MCSDHGASAARAPSDVRRRGRRWASPSRDHPAADIPDVLYHDDGVQQTGDEW